MILLYAAGAFLVIDSVLALVLGKRYVLWGLEHAPAAYRNFIMRLSGLPTGTLFLVKLLELAAGLFLLLTARWLV